MITPTAHDCPLTVRANWDGTLLIDYREGRWAGDSGVRAARCIAHLLKADNWARLTPANLDDANYIVQSWWRDQVTLGHAAFRDWAWHFPA